jgi:hypothetical protein
MPREKFLMLVFAALIGLTVLLFLMTARAATSNCEFIKDPDGRNFCLATTKKDPSWCEFIKSADTRNLCRATVKKP